MGGLFHPIGPEAEQTYWLRRGAVLVVLIGLLAGAGFMISSIGQAISGPAQPAAGPAAEASAPVPTTPAPTGPEPTPAPSGPEPTPAPSAPPSEAPKPSAVPVPVPSQPAATQARGTFGPGQSAPAGPAPAPPPANPAPGPAPGSFTVGGQQPGQPPACDPAKMRIRLDGPRRVTAGVPVTFRVKIVNDSGQPCRLPVDDKTFELKIYSGTDRIWSTLDCLSGMPAKNPILSPGQEFGWDQEWRANRSIGNCRAGAESLRSGTYVATAQLKDATPVQVIMQLNG